MVTSSIGNVLKLFPSINNKLVLGLQPQVDSIGIQDLPKILLRSCHDLEKILHKSCKIFASKTSMIWSCSCHNLARFQGPKLGPLRTFNWGVTPLTLFVEINLLLVPKNNYALTGKFGNCTPKILKKLIVNIQKASNCAPARSQLPNTNFPHWHFVYMFIYTCI
jgi:hypothetical protein